MCSIIRHGDAVYRRQVRKVPTLALAFRSRLLCKIAAFYADLIKFNASRSRRNSDFVALRSRSRRRSGIRPRTASTVPSHCTAVGKAEVFSQLDKRLHEVTDRRNECVEKANRNENRLYLLRYHAEMRTPHTRTAQAHGDGDGVHKQRMRRQHDDATDIK